MGQLFQTPAEKLQCFTGQQRQKAAQRADCCEAHSEARRAWQGRRQDWLPALLQSLQKRYPDLSVSASTLYRWFALYKTPADLIKLIDTRGGNMRGEADPGAWRIFQQHFLDPRQLSIRRCWQLTAEESREAGIRWTSLSECRRQLNAHVPPAMQAAARDPL